MTANRTAETAPQTTPQTTPDSTLDSKAAGNKAKNLIPVLVKDILPPIGAYYALHALGANDWVALLAGTVVSGLLLGYDAIRSRRLDPFAGFMLAMFGVGLGGSLIAGDPRFMLLKSSLVSAAMGVAFLVTTLVGKPLTYLAYRRTVSGDPAALAELDVKYRTMPGMRATLRGISMVWGIGLLAEAGLRAVLTYTLPVSTMVGLSTVLSLGTIALLMVVTVQVAKRAKRAVPVG